MESYVSAGITAEIDAPNIRAHADDTGIVSLLIGPLCITFKADDALTLASSLATVAATAVANKDLKLVSE